MKQAYSYVRFSTPEQQKGDSLRRQTQAAAEWCKRNDVRLDTSTTFSDLGRSAYLGGHRKNPDRNALAAFLKLVEAGKVPRGSYLIIENLDRLTREHIRPALTLLLNLIEDGIRVVQLKPVEQVYDEAVEPMVLMMAIMELSRGHGESRRKSELIGPAWQKKKAAAREGKPQPKNGMSLLTHCLPAWIEERGGKLVLIPAKAAIVKRIFQLAANGYGSKLIVRKFIKDKVPPMVKAFIKNENQVGGHWNGSYVRIILSDRRAMGEYQPKRNRGRELDGPPIPGYFPAAVTEDEWLAAKAGTTQRLNHRGRTSKDHVNLFSGLLKNALGGDSYHVVVRPPSNGRGSTERVLINGAAREGRAKCRSFPLATFEAAVLSTMKEIDPRDILDSDGAPDESVVLAGELARVDSKIAELESELLNGDVAALAKVLRQQEEVKKDLTARLDEARQRSVHPPTESWKEAKSLFDAVNDAPDPQDVRLRLRAALRRIIDSIWLLVVRKGHTRLAEAQVWFTGGKRYRTILIFHRPPRSNGKQRQDGRWCCRAITQPDDGLGFCWEDLRDPDLAGCVESGLSNYPEQMIDRLLRSGARLA